MNDRFQTHTAFVRALCVTTASLALFFGANQAKAEALAATDPDDTITVQARKRDEAIEDVPVSVTAISDDLADALVLDDVEDIVRQIPGGILVASGPEYLHDIALRGQGGGRIGFSESTTGIYRDGIFVAGGGFGGRSFSRIDFLDMAALEVYRGPQGALYGRNAVGGAVNLRTNKPTDEFSLRLKGGYNSVDRYEIESVVNIPLGDGIAFRGGGYYIEQNDGYYEDSVTGDALDTEEQWGIRGALGVDIDAATRAILTVETSSSKAPGFSTLGRNLVLDADPFVRTNLSITDQEGVTIDQTSIIGELFHEMDGMELTVLANYKTREGYRAPADFDHFLGLNFPGLAELTDDQGEDFERYGFEVRIASTSTGPWTWLAGADYQHFTSDVYSSRGGFLAGPLLGSAALRAQFRDDFSLETLSSYSAFGLVGYDFNDRLNLTVEARVQVDNKDFEFERVDTDPFTDQTIPFTTFEESWTRFLPTASLSYDFTDATTGYLRIATGYRPGGFNPQPTPGFFDRTPYDPEDITSYEAGLKGEYAFGGVTLRPRLALYYAVTDDVQQTTTLSTTNSTFTLQNVGGSTVYGGEFELDASAPLGDGFFNANLGLSTSNGDFDDGTSILFQGAQVDLSGLRVPRTRDYIVNLTATYAHPITEDLGGFATLSAQAEGGGYDNAAHTRSSEGYEIFDAYIGLAAENWRLTLYGKNLTDDIYRLVVVNNNAYYNTPRTYGATVVVNW